MTKKPRDELPDDVAGATMASNWPDEYMIPDRATPHISTCSSCGAGLSARAKQCNYCGRLLCDPEDPREHELLGDGRDGYRPRVLDIFRASLRDAKGDQGLMLDGRRWCESPRREEDGSDDADLGGGEGS